jgi:hypothetical protein
MALSNNKRVNNLFPDCFASCLATPYNDAFCKYHIMRHKSVIAFVLLKIKTITRNDR